ELPAAITALIDAGTAGGGPRPLDVIPLALDGEPELVREYPYLAIVVIAGADDASSAEVAAMANALKNRKTDPTHTVGVRIYPRPAPRLDALLDQFPNRSAYSAIDAADPTEAFASLLDYPRVSLGAPCPDWTPLDTDPVTDGVQPECSV